MLGECSFLCFSWFYMFNIEKTKTKKRTIGFYKFDRNILSRWLRAIVVK